LTQRVGESPVEFVVVDEKKWNENGARCHYKLIGYSMYVILREVEKHVFYGDLISTTQY
jgi:hypothetical protein